MPGKQRKPISRPPMLLKIDNFLNSVASLKAQEREGLWRNMKGARRTRDHVNIFKRVGLSLTKEEERHLREDWFGSKRVADPVVRAFSEGVVQAAKDGLPIVTVIHTMERDDAQASIITSEQQVTIIIHAPPPSLKAADFVDSVRHVKRENRRIVVVS